MSNIVGQFCKLLRFAIPANILDNILDNIFNLWNLFTSFEFLFHFRMFSRHLNFECFPFSHFEFKSAENSLWKCWLKCCQTHSKSCRHVGRNVGWNVGLNVVRHIANRTNMLAEMLAKMLAEMLARFAPPFMWEKGVNSIRILFFIQEV